MFATLYSAVQVDGVRLAACAGDCIDADGKKIEGTSCRLSCDLPAPARGRKPGGAKKEADMDKFPE